MTLIETSVIFIYFVIRFCFQIYNLNGVESTDGIRKHRISLGVLWLPLETIVYWNAIVEDDPCDLCAPPMPVTWYLAWVIFVVTDLLYQFHMISKIPKSNT